MPTLRDPKQEGTNLWDCIPQRGPCPMNCNQCYYNRTTTCPNCHGAGADKGCRICKDIGVLPAYYADWEPLIPTPQEVGDGIVRMNCGHDSNIQRDLIIKTAQLYKHVFFNTSIARFGFPGLVVFTANPDEESPVSNPYRLGLGVYDIDQLMFVRLRVSASNLELIEEGVRIWTDKDIEIPVVLTFMAYYDIPPQDPNGDRPYIWKIRHINSYWCATPEFVRKVLRRMKRVNDRLVTMCGTPESNYCRDCRNCESYYWQTIKRLKEC